MSALDRYSDGRYLAANPTWDEEESPWKTSLLLQILERNGVVPATVCDVGCGSGRMLQDLHQRLPAMTRLVGYEVSSVAFERCRSKESDRLSFVLGTLQDDPSGAVYDLALAMDVMEHVEDFYGFLRQLREHSHRQVLHIPLDVSVQTVLRSRPFAVRRDTVGHIHFFTKETALAALKDTGYEVLDSFYTTKPMNLSPKARFAQRIRRAPFRISPDLTVRILGGYSLLVLTM